MLRRMVLVGVMVCMLARVTAAETAANATATNETQSTFWGDAGYGTLAVMANIFYMPAKVVYATVGILTGGLAYLTTVGDTDTANKVWSPSLGGTYVVTPAMVRGDEPILFSGRSYSND